MPLLGGCSGALSTLDPAGPASAAIANLWWVMLAGAAVIFVLVMVLLAIGLRRRPSEQDAPRREPFQSRQSFGRQDQIGVGVFSAQTPFDQQSRIETRAGRAGAHSRSDLVGG